MRDSRITNARQFAIDRFVNSGRAAEGSTLTPKQAGDLRVPLVTNLRIIDLNTYIGGSTFTLQWTEPDGSTGAIGQYNVYVSGLDGVTQPQGPFSTFRSPAVVRLSTAATSRIVFTVQTQLTNGMCSPLKISPSVAAEVVYAHLTSEDLPLSGVGAGTYGSASVVPVLVVTTAGTISSATNTQIYLDRLRLPVLTQTSGPYTITATNFSVYGDTTSGSFTINLPASPAAGDMYFVKKIVAANTLTLSGNGNNIGGAASIAITSQYHGFMVQWTGTEWMIMSVTLI